MTFLEKSVEMVGEMEATQADRLKRGETARRQWSFNITDRDREILLWVARMRFAKIDQIARRFGMGRTASYRRVQALKERGLLERCGAYLGEGPGIVLVTPLGLALGGSGLSLPEIDVRQFEHDRELVELVIDYELQGGRVYADRELRSVARKVNDRAGQFRFEVGDLRGRHHRRYHYPDLIVERPEGRLAVELEFADKGDKRLREILEGYCYARGIDQLVYFVRRPNLVERIERLMRRTEISETAEVRLYEERSG